MIKKKTTRIPEAYSAGFLAKTQGKLRVVPVLFLTEKGVEASKEWYRGWDAANIAAKEPPTKPPLYGLVIVVSGNPVDGFYFFGPFKTGEDAIEWAERSRDGRTDWWIAPLAAE